MMRGLLGLWRDRRGEAELENESWATIGWIVAIAVVVGLVGAARWYFGTTTRHDTIALSATALADQLDSQARTSWSIAVPPLDALGNANNGQFMSFFKRTSCVATDPCGPNGTGQDLFWGYQYDSGAHTLTYYAQTWNGNAFTGWKAKNSIPNVYGMNAVWVSATARANPNSQYYDPLLASLHGVVKNIDCSYGFTDYHGNNGTVQYKISFGKNGADGFSYGRLKPDNIYCAQQVNYAGTFTPPPMGPLHTLGKIVFAPGAVSAAKAPIDVRVAQLINDALGGGTATAAGVTCSYARLFYPNGTPDSGAPNNPPPGIKYPDQTNHTDSNGCVKNGQVWLYGIEQNYTGQFDLRNTCASYIGSSAFSWTYNSYVTITPVAVTSGCDFPVEDSSYNTIANGGAPDVTAIVQPAAPTCDDSGNTWEGPKDNTCYDLYNIAVNSTQTGAWITEGIIGIYVPSGTTGNQLYKWTIDNSDPQNVVCAPSLIGSYTQFAHWGLLIGNGDPTPPPVGPPTTDPNPAGFTKAYIDDTIDIEGAPAPRPTKPPAILCKSWPPPSTPP